MKRKNPSRLVGAAAVVCLAMLAAHANMASAQGNGISNGEQGQIDVTYENYNQDPSTAIVHT